MTTVADILSARKNGQLATLPPTATVREALQLMADREIGSVLLMQGHALLGIFTERDYARKIALKGLMSVDAAGRRDDLAPVRRQPAPYGAGMPGADDPGQDAPPAGGR
jgi:CBS domain-containing protein